MKSLTRTRRAIFAPAVIDKSEGFNVALPSYQHVLQNFSTAPAKPKADPRVGPNPNAALDPQPTTDPKRHTTRVHPKESSAPSRWLPTSIFGLSKTAKQVRDTTQSLLRDLLSQARPSEHEWLSVLTSCSEACDAQGLDFSALLQEPFVEGHTPVYWAILKRPVIPVKADHTTPTTDPDALVMAILDASLPLNSQSVADTRLACMTVSDNALFVRLGQRYEGFSPHLGTDKVLLGGADTVDSVVVVDEPRGGDAFTVRFSLAQFPLRMRASKLARVEFIARGAFAAGSLSLSPLPRCLYVLKKICPRGVPGRLWQLVFAVAGAPGAPPGRVGQWLVSLSLSEPSSPAWVDARLSALGQSLPPPDPDPPQTTGLGGAFRGFSLPRNQPNHGKQRPTASLAIKTKTHQLSPSGRVRQIVVSLEKSAFGTSLQN
ncbi:hypothetical protein H4582DRAFT_2081063 [Lactarius indigo]|nr:hypothetical protein H4582DRAFT_2081063 [Lactarius indigo]